MSVSHFHMSQFRLAALQVIGSHLRLAATPGVDNGLWGSEGRQEGLSRGECGRLSALPQLQAQAGGPQNDQPQLTQKAALV